MKRSFQLAAAAALMCSTSLFAQTTSRTDPSNPGDAGVTPTTDPANRAGQGMAPTTTLPSSATDTMDTTTTGTGMTVGTSTQTTPSTTTTTQGTAQGTTTTQPGTTTTTGSMSASGTMPSGAMRSTDFAAFDTDNDGQLTPLEFAQLDMARQAPASGGPLVAEAKRERYSKASGNGAIKLLNDTAADFSKADQNHDKRISQDELAMWESGGAMTPSSTMTPSTTTTTTTNPTGTMSDMPSRTGTTTTEEKPQPEPDQTTPPYQK